MKIFIYKTVKSIIGLLPWIFILNLQAQDEMRAVLPGPKGAVVMLMGVYAEDTNISINPEERVYIYRMTDNEKERKVGETGFPKSAGELRAKLGDFTDKLQAEYNVTTDVQLYNKLTSLPLDSLGILLISYDVSEALGFVFLDESFRPGSATEYRIERVDRSKNVISERIAKTDGRFPEYKGILRLKDTFVTDSLVLATWGMGIEFDLTNSIFIQADIYRQKGNGFQRQGSTMLSENTEADSVFVSIADELVPGGTYTYYLQLTDWAGNSGLPSDTLYALAFNKHNLKPVLELVAEPQTDAILLTWEPLPQEAIYTGIEIQKSRNYDSAYVVLDTLPSSAAEFLDTRTLKGSTYYYRVRPLYLLDGEQQMSHAEVTATLAYPKDNSPPLTPEGVVARATSNGIEISWWAPDELDIFGYLVYRGYSPEIMELVSSTVEDNVYVDTLVTPGYSGQLLYAVQALNYNQQYSDTSAIVTVDIRQPAYVTPPAGLSARKVAEGISLHWNNVKEIDDNVMAYVVFRKKAGQHDFKVIHQQAINLPYYIDSTYRDSEVYEYAVSSVDIWGNFSALSPMTKVDLQEEYEWNPPVSIRLRNLGSGIEVSWPVSLTGKKGAYVIYRREEGEREFVKIGEVAVTGIFVDKTVNQDIAYEYRVANSFMNKEGEPSVSAEMRR